MTMSAIYTSQIIFFDTYIAVAYHATADSLN